MDRNIQLVEKRNRLLPHERVANHEASFTNKDEKFNVLFSWSNIKS
ncbi:hypothetical protein RZN22_10365 [Bacillaceae bacterium S4-13-58]